MAMNRIPCPECGAVLKSATGFKIGQSVCCPKCETYFNVEEPEDETEAAEEADSPKKTKPEAAKAGSGKNPLKAKALSDVEDEEDFQPKKKKKKKKKSQDDDEEEWSYKNSPLRYAVLGVLIIVMLVLGFFLYQKYQKQHAEETASTSAEDDAKPADPRPGAAVPLLPVPKINGPQGRLPGPIPPGGFRPGGLPGGQQPKLPAGNPSGPGIMGGLLGGSTSLTAAEKTQLLAKYKQQLIGTWKADLGAGKTAQLVFAEDGKVNLTVTSPMKTETRAGTWTATGMLNRSSLQVMYKWEKFPNSPKPSTLVFEDNELEHPIFGEAGLVGIFRKS